MDKVLGNETIRRVIAEKKDAALQYVGAAREKLQEGDYSALKPVIRFAQSAGKRVKQAKAVKHGAEKLRAARQKLPTRDHVKSAALSVWGKLVGLFAAVCAGFRNPGLSELAALAAFLVSALGSIGAVFSKKLRRFLPLFGILAAIGTVIVILRVIFPRRED